MGWEAFSKIIQFEVGVGDKVKLRTDQWCRDSPLQLTFLVVYEIASNKEASVASSLERLEKEEQSNGEAGMFVSFGDQMIGKWVMWMHFFVLWALIYLQLRMGTVCDGSYRRMGILMFALFIIS